MNTQNDELENLEYVSIPKSQYVRLLQSERELTALNCAGVDNWPGRDYINWDYVETGKGDPNRE